MSVVPPGAFPPPNSRYSPPCDSRLAEGKSARLLPVVDHCTPTHLPRLTTNPIPTHVPAGCIRGSYVGALWGLLFHRYDVKPLPSEASRARVLAHTFRIRAGAGLLQGVPFRSTIGVLIDG